MAKQTFRKNLVKISEMHRMMFILIFTFIAFWVHGQIKLPKIVSDGMVLQRDTELTIWGWASANEAISIEFGTSTYSTQADLDGNWSIEVPPLPAGGPYTMTITGTTSVQVEDIMIGDVWICSGQSNMELNMSRVRPMYQEEITNANYPGIRYFHVPREFDFKSERTDLSSGEWVKTTPKTVLTFAAVSYFFGKELHNRYDVPIGLINTALGGSPVESWISEEELKKFPEHYEEALRWRDDELIRSTREKEGERSRNWYATSTKNDKGYQSNPTWHANADTKNWPSMNVPGFWKDTELGNINGVVWFQKDFMLNEIPSTDSKLILGTIVDADSVFVNGVFVGRTTYQYPPRRYTVPEGVLKQGKNEIVIRVVNERGSGGFTLEKAYELYVGKKVIDLSGEWNYQLGTKMDPLPGQTFIRWKPMGLFNAMIAPLLNYRMKGVIWYQGESNTDNPVAYRETFPAMIRDWRNRWGQGDFPFLYVQLANFMASQPEPGPSDWAMTREAQSLALDEPNTAMAVTIDIGEWNDIHPLNKKDVGFRLAAAAQRIAYDEPNVYSGPRYKSHEVKDGQITLQFDHVGSGLTSTAQNVKGFAIAGEDQKYVWATAEIRGNTIVVFSKDVPKPAAVRYAWADNPEAGLYNKEGFPAIPFRTDSWVK